MRIAVPNPNQFNVSLRPELKKRLEDLAEEFGEETGLNKGTKVGAKIIETYVEHWAQLQERIREGKRRVEQEILGNLERPPLVKGETDRKRPTTGRRIRR